MKKTRLCIYYTEADKGKGKVSDNFDMISFEGLVRIARSRSYFKYINRYSSVTLVCPSFDSIVMPFFTAVICRFMTIGSCIFVDNNNQIQSISFLTLIRLFTRFLYEIFTFKCMLKSISNEIDELCSTHKEKPAFNNQYAPLYLRCDATFGIIAGGSVAHISGVVNSLSSFFEKPVIFITSTSVPTTDENIDTRSIIGRLRYGNIRDVMKFTYNPIIYNTLNNELLSVL